MTHLVPSSRSLRSNGEKCSSLTPFSLFAYAIGEGGGEDVVCGGLRTRVCYSSQIAAFLFIFVEFHLRMRQN